MPELARRVAVTTICLVLLVCGRASAEAQALAARLEPFIRSASGAEPFALVVDVQAKIGSTPHHGTVRAERIDDDTFLFIVDHPEHGLRLERTRDRTALVLPARGVAFVGEGALDGPDVLTSAGLISRLTSRDSSVAGYLALLRAGNADGAALLLTRLMGFRSSDDGVTWSAGGEGGATLRFAPDNPSEAELSMGETRLKLRMEKRAAKLNPMTLERLKVHRVDRAELERLVVRGLRRGSEVQFPGATLKQPARQTRLVPNGELRWQSDQRLVLLSGTPSEIGTAHGQLLAEEVRRCSDSALYVVGLANVLATGKWFPDELRGAYQRVAPHLPPDHVEELDALADAAGISREEARLANVFPELFHCSGFAVFGSATVDGKLYHGRVLDYMTQIGLQDAAAVFIVRPKGKLAFANVGYAGFIGSVSGMNEKQISLGEMGGQGEGQWDGVPMATLMRRALEECSTLADVRKLWTDSPRTCEYYYVFADGKGPNAVGVKATPESIEFIDPGQPHSLLGPGIADAVLLSAGDRLECLRGRVTDSLGQIDAAGALELMSRPVAMTSNLHNVLFVPQDGVFFVAQASRDAIAAERPYVRFDLRSLLASSASAASNGN